MSGGTEDSRYAALDFAERTELLSPAELKEFKARIYDQTSESVDVMRAALSALDGDTLFDQDTAAFYLDLSGRHLSRFKKPIEGEPVVPTVWRWVPRKGLASPTDPARLKAKEEKRPTPTVTERAARQHEGLMKVAHYRKCGLDAWKERHAQHKHENATHAALKREEARRKKNAAKSGPVDRVITQDEKDVIALVVRLGPRGAGALFRQALRTVTRSDGTILGFIGLHTHSAEELCAEFEQGALIERMTFYEALFVRAWAHPDARKPWADLAHRMLEQSSQALQHAGALTEEIALSRFLEAAPTAQRPNQAGP
jgi:hypothetical protein